MTKCIAKHIIKTYKNIADKFPYKTLNDFKNKLQSIIFYKIFCNHYMIVKIKIITQ